MEAMANFIAGILIVFAPAILILIIPKGVKMSRQCALDLSQVKEDGWVYSIVYGKGRCVMLMDDSRYEFYINVHFDTGKEKAYNKHGIHDIQQKHRDLYAGATHPWLAFVER